MFVDDFLPKGEQLTAWDFVFSSLSNPFMMVLMIPIIFCYLIGDLIVKDYDNGYITLIASRIPNRTAYFFAKFAVIIVAAALLFFGYLTILVALSLMFRLPFHGRLFFSVLRSVDGHWSDILMLLITNAELFILSLVALGLFILSLSLFFHHPIVGYVGVIALVLQSHDPVFNDHSKLLMTPFAQGILALHAPFYFYNVAGSPHQEILQRFTVLFSTLYCFAAFVIFLLLGWLRIKRMNMYLKG